MTRVSLYNIKQRSPLTTHKPDRLFYPHQIAITPSSPNTRSPILPTSNSDRHLVKELPDSWFKGLAVCNND